MPELPEVETVVRGIRPGLLGATITRLDLYHPRVHRRCTAKALRAGVEGGKVSNVTRRGKFILIEFADARPPLVIHLGMSGRLLFEESARTSKHLRATLHFADEAPLYFEDIRTFGVFFLVDGAEPAGFRELGLEPLSSKFTKAAFKDIRSEEHTSELQSH